MRVLRVRLLSPRCWFRFSQLYLEVDEAGGPGSSSGPATETHQHNLLLLRPEDACVSTACCQQALGNTLQEPGPTPRTFSFSLPEIVFSHQDSEETKLKTDGTQGPAVLEHTHTHVHTPTYAHTCLLLHAKHICTQACTRMHTLLNAPTHLHADTHAPTHMHIYTCMLMHTLLNATPHA